MIINTFSGDKAGEDEKKIRTIAVHAELPLLTTVAAARAVALAIAALRRGKLNVKPLQEYHRELAGAVGGAGGQNRLDLGAGNH
jgi:carbamoyl-phosphate synthase large subunit